MGTRIQEVVVIAADGARWTAKAMHLKRLQFRALARKKLRLHFLRDRQLILQTLLLFLLQDQLLDGLRHGIERERQLRQLIAGSHRYPMAEVPTIYMFGGVMELRHRLRYRSGHARTGEQSDQFDDQEEDSDAQQNVSYAGGE